MSNYPHIPVYYVIDEQYRNSPQYDIRVVLFVFECYMDDVDKLYEEYARPLWQKGHSPQSKIYLREPKPLFKEWLNYHIEGTITNAQPDNKTV